MDRLTAEHRSWLMSRVKSRDTKPELLVRKLVFAMGYRYRLHVRDLPGKPDLVFSRKRKVIFVHGCFWHGHERCRYGRLPKTRQEFWSNKIEQNRARDVRTVSELKNGGWRVLEVWQCQLKDFDGLAKQLNEFLEEC